MLVGGWNEYEFTRIPTKKNSWSGVESIWKSRQRKNLPMLTTTTLLKYINSSIKNSDTSSKATWDDDFALILYRY